jgi:hypothetical protein
VQLILIENLPVLVALKSDVLLIRKPIPNENGFLLPRIKFDKQNSMVFMCGSIDNFSRRDFLGRNFQNKNIHNKKKSIPSRV